MLVLSRLDVMRKDIDDAASHDGLRGTAHGPGDEPARPDVQHQN
jgi:hypothetical protein